MNRQEMIDVIENALNGEFNYQEGLADAIADAVIAAQGDEAAEFHVRRNAPDTSKAITDKIRGGSLQADILALYRQGATYGAVGFSDDEVESALKRSHQSVSGSRNTLVRKGYLVDSGERRPNRYGNMAIRWTWTGKAES